MKKLITILLILVGLSSFSQETLKQVNDSTNTTSNVNNDIEAFRPNEKLLNKQIWQRVAANRFECKFLRLAVELKNNEYLLLEMDGNKRLLARHEQYSIISGYIVNLTLRPSPNLIEKQKKN